MKKLMMIFAAMALLAGCGSSVEGGGDTTEIPERQELHYEALEVESDSTINYMLGDGYAFCPKAGELARFQLNVGTGQGTAALFREGDESTETCLDEVGIDEMVCMVEEEVTLELDAKELEAVVTAVEAIPTLICEPGYECDLCAVDQLTVGGETHYSNCCTDGNREEWRDRMDAAIALMTEVTRAATLE